MKRILSLLFLLLLTGVPVPAQNNPYEIDDECYRLFQQTELTAGKPEFRTYSDSLRARALAVKDRKAEVLYYVGELKHVIRGLPTSKPVTEQDDLRVEKAKEVLLKVSEEYGYMQYYFYGLELTQNYYYNHGRRVQALKLAEEAHADATRRKSEYGIWYTSRYLISLYRTREDFRTAKQYILEALHTYETTSDPTIRRQSPTRLLCDLSDTYPVGSDSMYINIDKAAKAAISHLDSVRVRFYQTVCHALRKETAEYHRNAELLRNDPSFTSMNIARPVFFECVDILVDGGKVVNPERIATELVSSRNVKFVANIAENYGDGDFAFALEKQLVDRMEADLSKIGVGNIEELDAALGNTTLSASLRQKEEDLAHTTKLVIVLLALLLVSALVVTLMRISSLRKAQKRDEEAIAKLTEANERVRLANEAKTRFVQNMSHEVRTPLNAIVGFSQLLSLPDGSFPEDEKAEFANHIVNNSKMLNMLLDDILNASSMDSGGYSILLEDCDCHFVCNAAISSAEHRLQPGVTMTYKPEEPGPVHFQTDPRRLQQILINYLTNACKHTTEGSIVLTSSTSAEPGRIVFAVEDTGTGVPADKAEAIFGRFTKLNEFVQGTGLGLSICREIAEKMGGRVWLDTSYGPPGARFVLSLPLHHDAA
ncbi:MAG: HAMP domain-containing histidine kinase [Bacteroidales bacterium]|nr:HAMP domain-containing histidine kinase [Bacteroidales bacterium]